MNEEWVFTAKDYEQFMKNKSGIKNQKYRKDKESFFDAIESKEADFTITEEGKAALQAIAAIGEPARKKGPILQIRSSRIYPMLLNTEI